jgi:hypothetical protein
MTAKENRQLDGNEQIINTVVIRLVENAGKIQYGNVSATLTIHEGRVVSICHEVKETVREKGVVK